MTVRVAGGSSAFIAEKGGSLGKLQIARGGGFRASKPVTVTQTLGLGGTVAVSGTTATSRVMTVAAGGGILLHQASNDEAQVGASTKLINLGTVQMPAGVSGAKTLSIQGTFQNDGSFLDTSPSGFKSGGIFIINGQSSKIGAGTTRLGSDFQNNGSVNVTTGTLEARSKGNNSASFNVSLAAQLAFPGAATGAEARLGPGASVTGAGKVSMLSSRLAWQGEIGGSGILLGGGLAFTRRRRLEPVVQAGAR